LSLQKEKVMAEKKNSRSALTRLTPNSVDMKIDGQDIRVATDSSENRIMNMVMASQMRSLIQQSLKKFAEQDVTLTPKEIRDMAEAAKSVAAFSAEVYSVGEGIDVNKSEKPAENQETSDAEPDFASLVSPKIPEVETKQE
jgi:hypothetical protein